VLKERSRDPYSHVRRINPPVDFPHKTKLEYNRNKTKQETEEILKEELEDLEGDEFKSDL